MEQESVRGLIAATHRIRGFAAFALLMLGLFLIVVTIGQIKSIQYIGSGIAPSDTISVNGHGEVFAVPDTAEFDFTVSDTEKDVSTAQSKASADENTIVDYLKSQGVADTDIQTTDYSVQPQYEYQAAACPVASGDAPVYCPPGKQTLTGYQVSETVTVKVKDTTKAGALLSAIGGKGATNISGLSFVVSDQDALQNQARGKAIQDAQAKAEMLASQLGVHLVRVTSFNENNATPVYAPRMLDMAAGSTAAAPAPELPTGQNKITDDVSLTYEIQ